MDAPFGVTVTWFTPWAIGLKLTDGGEPGRLSFASGQPVPPAEPSPCPLVGLSRRTCPAANGPSGWTAKTNPGGDFRKASLPLERQPSVPEESLQCSKLSMILDYDAILLGLRPHVLTIVVPNTVVKPVSDSPKDGTVDGRMMGAWIADPALRAPACGSPVDAHRACGSSWQTTPAMENSAPLGPRRVMSEKMNNSGSTGHSFPTNREEVRTRPCVAYRVIS